MSEKKQESRRSFLSKTGGAGAVAVAAPLFISSSAMSGPNDLIGLGFIGVGRRGTQLMGDFRRTKGAEFRAISDINIPRMDQVASGKNWKKYQDFRKLLEDKDIDAVVVATPDHWHALNSIYACMAEKHVYCEKPMTLTIREGRVMVQAARKYNCIVQCGSQQRSSDPCRIGCEMVRNARVGKIHTVHAQNYPSPWDQPFPDHPVPEGLDWDMWLGPTLPNRGYHKDLYTPRARPGWISIMAYSGGEVAGWGAHGFDIIQWGLGMDESGPREIWPEGSYQDLDRPVNMKYANGTVMKADGKGPSGGGLFVGDKGSVFIDRGKYKVDPESAGKLPLADTEEHLYVSKNHQQNYLDCIKSGELPIADVEIGHRSSTVCHLVNIARWTNRKLQWDPVKEEFIGDKDANTYIDRPRRKPWELPKI